MQTLGVIQARMTSTRLPGKVMMPILGEPMIVHQLRRTARATQLDRIVVATSTDPSDDQLAELITQTGFDVVRGSLDDVLARFVQVIDAYQPEVVVRMTADCPLISPKVIDHVVDGFHKSGFDYRSNTLQPSFPDGLDVEVVRSAAIRTVHEVSTDVHEREHVTLGIYRRLDQFRLENFRNPVDLSHHRWTVDNEADLAFVQWVYESLDHRVSRFELDDILQLLTKYPRMVRTNEHGVRNAALTGIDTGAMWHSAPSELGK